MSKEQESYILIQDYTCHANHENPYAHCHCKKTVILFSHDKKELQKWISINKEENTKYEIVLLQKTPIVDLRIRYE